MHVFPADGSAGDVLLDTIDDVDLTDELGIDSAWKGEHHVSHYGLLGNPHMQRSVLAERTTYVTVGSAVAVLPWGRPRATRGGRALLDIPPSLAAPWSA